MRISNSIFLCLIILYSCKKDKVLTPSLPFIAPDSFHTVNACNNTEPYVNEINFLNEQNSK